MLLSDFEYDYVARQAPDAHRFFIALAMPVPGRLAPYEGRAGFLFVGGFVHAPNVDAVHFLCGTIWPLVRGLLPEAALFVVGADTPDEISAYDRRDGIRTPTPTTISLSKRSARKSARCGRLSPCHTGARAMTRCRTTLKRAAPWRALPEVGGDLVMRLDAKDAPIARLC